MIALGFALVMCAATDCAACEALKGNNIFCPVTPPPPVQREPAPPPPPPPPRRRPVGVSGFVYDTPSEAYYVLFHDVQWETPVYCKAGETYLDIEVVEVGPDSARIRLEGAEREVRLGDRIEVLDRGRPPQGFGRLAPPAPSAIPGMGSARPAASSGGSSGGASGRMGEGLLERMRRIRERWGGRGNEERRQP